MRIDQPVREEDQESESSSISDESQETNKNKFSNALTSPTLTLTKPGGRNDINH